MTKILAYNFLDHLVSNLKIHHKQLADYTVYMLQHQANF